MKEEVKLLVSGLPENSGPGDLLGAISNEAPVEGDAVGEIEISGSVAKVSVPGHMADSVVKNLDRVSGKPVSVARADSSTLESHFLRLAHLVEMEREEEMKRHETEMRRLSGPKREKEGRALLHLRGRDEGTGLGGKYLIKFIRQRPGEALPDTEITIGDLVMLSKGDPLKTDNPTGTVSDKTNYSITVAFDLKPAKFLYRKGLRCDLYVNDITYQRQLEALTKICESRGRIRELAEKSLGMRDLEFSGGREDVDPLDEGLNRSQIKAMRKALSSRDFFLIHGPPGTGKTVTCVEVARQLIRRGERVLCTADSNTAVDNLVERLAEYGERVVRIGHPARVTPMLRKHTLDEVIQENPTYIESQDLRERALGLVEKQGELTHPGGRWRRGMSNGKIMALAKRGKGSRGVPRGRIKEMAKWLELQSRIDDIFSRARRLEEEAIDEVLEWARVVCATNSGCGSEIMAGREFDSVVIDEATQATEPSCWVSMIRADKVIMAGDHRQLPPTILSQRAQGLSRTLFESLIERHGDECRTLLTTQYRMNTKIMGFANEHFYDGLLRADESVAHHTILDLIEASAKPDNEGLLAEPIAFVDTSKIEARERRRRGSTSKENPVEAEIVQSIVAQLLELGIRPTDIAVIAPYDDQSDLLRRLIGEENLEIDTVDGFQGREKEVVLVSLVRSNLDENIGFLKDVRRLNVSLTRARRKLIVIGDASTISVHDTYADLVEYVSENGQILKLDKTPVV